MFFLLAKGRAFLFITLYPYPFQKALDVDVPQAEGVSLPGGLLHLSGKVKQFEVHGFSSLLRTVPVLLQVIRGPCG